jgi:hypothetical protein
MELYLYCETETEKKSTHNMTLKYSITIPFINFLNNYGYYVYHQLQD